MSKLGGVDSILEMLRTMDSESQDKLLTELEKQDSELVRVLKKRIFSLEKLIEWNNEDIQKIIAQISSKQLALAQRLASEPLKEKLFSNMTARALVALKELPEFQNPQKKSLVEEAQNEIIEIAKKISS